MQVSGDVRQIFHNIDNRIRMTYRPKFSILTNNYIQSLLSIFECKKTGVPKTSFWAPRSEFLKAIYG